MNLNTERKVKFWLGTVSKVLIIALILFQLGPYLFGKKDKDPDNNDSISKNSEITLDSIKREGKKSNLIEQNVSFQNNQPEKKDKPITNEAEKRNTNIIPNTVSIYIFNENTLDTQIGKQLGNTYLKDYIIKTVKTNYNREKLIAGNVISFSETELICVGTITYNFKKDTTKTTCELVVNFDTYSTKTGVKYKTLSQSISRYGIGFSIEQARQNAIKKIN